MTTTKAYDDLVEGFREKIRGNVVSKKMTPEECAAEISSIQGGAVSRFAEPISGSFTQTAAGTESMQIYPHKRGWPKGKKRGPRGGKNPFGPKGS